MSINMNSLLSKIKLIFNFDNNFWKFVSKIIIPVLIPLLLFKINYDINQNSEKERKKSESTQQELKILEIFTPVLFSKDPEGKKVALTVLSKLSKGLWPKIFNAFVEDSTQPEGLRIKAAKLIQQVNLLEFKNYNISIVFERSDNTSNGTAEEWIAYKIRELILKSGNSNISVTPKIIQYPQIGDINNSISISVNPLIDVQARIKIAVIINSFFIDRNLRFKEDSSFGNNTILIYIKQPKQICNFSTRDYRWYANTTHNFIIEVNDRFEVSRKFVINWGDNSLNNEFDLTSESPSIYNFQHTFTEPGTYLTQISLYENNKFVGSELHRFDVIKRP